MISRGKNHKSKKEKIVEDILCEKYNSYYRLAMSYVHNESDAMDIVQEGAYKAIRQSHALRDPAFASTWLYRIMLNEIYRFLGAKKTVSLEEADFLEPEYEDVYEDIDLKRALDAMSREDKAAIELKYFEGLKLSEIADILGENVNTVKSRMYRGLKKLRIELEEQEG